MYLDKLIPLPKETEKRLRELGYRPLKAEDKAVCDEFYDRMNDDWSSPMSFMAMIAWKKTLPFYYKITEGYLTLLGWDAIDGRMTMLPFVGRYEDGPIRKAFQIVRDDHKTMGYPLCITDMREWMRPYYDRIENTGWVKTESDALNDYVYEGRHFDDFRGKSGQNLRYFLKTFDRHVENVVPGDLDRLRDFVRENWCGHHDCADCNYGCTIDCLEQIVPDLPVLGGFGIIVSIDGRMAGYCIGSRHGRVSILHFQTTAGDHKGLGVFMYHECRKRFLADIERISLGEDMGMSGIRTYKTRLAPHDWIPRFEYLLADEQDTLLNM